MTKKLHSFLVAFCFAGSSIALAQTEPSEKEISNVRGPLEKMPESLEVSLALSALPPPLRDKAPFTSSTLPKVTFWNVPAATDRPASSGGLNGSSRIIATTFTTRSATTR
jgi:hypothetical protein